MNTQKKQRKIQLELSKDNGDMRKEGKEPQASDPRDRGDTRRKYLKKVSKQELFKTTEDTVETDAARSTNTSAELPLSVENHTNVHASEKSLDFRDRVKDRYTFKRIKLGKNDDNMSHLNVVRYAARSALPKLSYSEYADKQAPYDFQHAKKSDKTPVHRAVSAMKIKRTSKSDEERKRIDTDKNTKPRKDRKPVIKTIASMDTRVYKAVTFEEQPVRKPLRVKMPIKDVKPKTISCDQNQITTKITRSIKRMVRKRTPQSSPPFKSADSLPTEIAKWVPESVDKHTQPYYEAWVSKTATASTKLLKQAHLEKSKVLRSIELERKNSSELLYTRYAEEEYAGRIRVRRRGEK